eukprot:TRINITY_DN90623_c0_g1_i1.p1 TRINITY_DN90623_c0_g1~~TRINITY_DN90623_c0_g1_i1.p1  ORF type:complete len:484 (-),score=133.43 TRINITY_DN90623_c0_g1_i1:35-1486(-)
MRGHDAALRRAAYVAAACVYGGRLVQAGQPGGGLSEFEKAVASPEADEGVPAAPLPLSKHVHGMRLPEELAAEAATAAEAAAAARQAKVKTIHSLAEGMQKATVQAKLGEPGKGPVMDMAVKGETTCVESLGRQGCRCFSRKPHPHGSSTDPCYGLYPCIDCSGSFLKSFPSDLPKTTAYLNLDNSELDELPLDLFARLPQLEGLGLAGSRLAALHSNIFGVTNGQKEIEEYIKDVELLRTQNLAHEIVAENLASADVVDGAAEDSDEIIHKLPERPPQIRQQQHARSGGGHSEAAPLSFVQKSSTSTQAQSRHRMALQALSQVFTTADTCSQLFWFGFYEVDTCRDTWSPQYGSNCRCNRGGVAWPVKFCDATAGQLKTATNGTDEIDRSNRKLENEVFGICEACCTRDHIITMQLILLLLSPLFLSVAICTYLGRASHESNVDHVLQAKAKARAFAITHRHLEHEHERHERALSKTPPEPR